MAADDTIVGIAVANLSMFRVVHDIFVRCAGLKVCICMEERNNIAKYVWGRQFAFTNVCVNNAGSEIFL